MTIYLMWKGLRLGDNPTIEFPEAIKIKDGIIQIKNQGQDKFNKEIKLSHLKGITILSK